MVDTHTLLHARVLYSCREGFYHAMQQAAIEGLKTNPGDVLYRFYYGVSLILEGRIDAAMRELHTVQDHQDVCLGSILALMFSYKKEQIKNHEALAELDAKWGQYNKHASDKAVYSAGLFYVFTGVYDKAKELTDRLVKFSPNFREASVLRGWIELLTLKEKTTSDVLKNFESSNNSDPEAVFGRAKYHQLKKNYFKASELLNQAVVLFPQYAPAFIEKSKIQLAVGDWEQAYDTSLRLLNIERNSIEAKRNLVLYLLCRKGDYKEAHEKIEELVDAMHQVEPKNALLFYETSQLLCRLCGRNLNMLQSADSLIQEAVSVRPSDVDIVNEIAYQCLLQEKTKDALKCYRKAAKIDESSVESLKGIIFCQILEGQLELAEQQLELFQELNRSSGMSSEMLFLYALLAQKQAKSPDIPVNFLQKCTEEHLAALQRDSTIIPNGVKYYTNLNPDFLLLVCKLCMNYIPDQPITPGQPFPPALLHCQTVLNVLTSACPGLMEASYFMAKLKYLTGDTVDAKLMLESCLQKEVSYVDARLLLARILFDDGNFRCASQALEVALSYNFKVREQPLFQLLMAKIQKTQGLLEESVKTLQTGMTLAGLRSSSGSNVKLKQQLSIHDQVSLFLELVDCYWALNKQAETIKVLQEANVLFKGTPEEGRIMISLADIEMSKGNVDEALNMLRGVGAEQPYYLQAREKMANIYLNHRKDKKFFALCYKEVVDQYPTTRSYILLGDAYMKIQETKKAIEVYEEALKKSPRDSILTRKIGQALIKTHNFEKAVTYYKAAIKTGGQVALRYDLAELLFQMRRYKEAEDVISAALEVEKQANDLTWLQWESKIFLLLSRVCSKMQNEDKAVSILHKAWEVQTRVMRRIHLEDPDGFQEQRKIATDICQQLAEHATSKKEFSPAVQFYKEALSFDDENAEILLAIAKLETEAGNLDSARQYCQSVLKADNMNDSATLMMADIMFRKMDMESAVYHFQNLLSRKPDYYSALARFVEANRRLGKLDEMPLYLEKAEESAMCSATDAGFNYCKGLYEWYTGNTSGAIKFFNKARNDVEWGQIATYHMIEICVNPENEAFSSEALDGADSMHNEYAHSQDSAVRTAEKLLNELKAKVGPDLDIRIMGNFILLARRNKNDAEDALNDFLQIVSDDRNKDHVGAILGMATAYVILKQTPRARNQLKKLAHYSWNFSDAEYLERAWLLLADISIKAGKLETAAELLKNVLQHNKSCTKAYEYMGNIMEKDQNHREAATFYDLAWKQTKKANPAVGYKLAFNYVKAKRYVDAIDVCHDVMSKYPNYPKIRKEILEKSRNNLRI